MIGAIAGDIIGSVYEGRKCRGYDFPLFDARCTFTDDTVATLAVCKALLLRKTRKRAQSLSDNGKRALYQEQLHTICRQYPTAGYGANFKRWLETDNPRPYGSYGNGSAMRVSGIGFAFNDLNTVLKEARLSAEISHNHPEGIKGAQAIAACIFLARQRKSKDALRQYIARKFKYNLNQPLEYLIKNYGFDISCQGSVPQAIIAFLEGHDFEDTIRKAILIGGDSDTIACMAGGIAQAFYRRIPRGIITKVKILLDANLKKILVQAEKAFKIEYRIH